MDQREEDRLNLLKSLEILDTPPEPDFDDIARLASRFVGAPIAWISLVDQNRQWFKAKTGVTVSETSREVAFCTHAIRGSDLFIVPDATKDARFKSNPLVTGEPGIRFYAGVPLVMKDGLAVGTLCVMDRTPRDFGDEQKEVLKWLANQVVHHLRCRVAGRTLRRLHGAVEVQPGGLLIESPSAEILHANRGILSLFDLGERPPKNHFEVAECFANPKAFMERVAGIRESGRRAVRQEFELEGGRWVECDYAPLFENGVLDAHVWTYREITERKKDELLLEYQRLQMQESQRLSSLGEMAGGLAHEINNPLTVILGRAAHLQELNANHELDPAVVTKYTQEIIDVTRRVIKIIKGLRSFARVGDNDPMEDVEISEIAGDTLAFCQQKIRGEGIQLKVPALDCHIKVRVRATQISQILLNLVSNAVDALKGGSERWIEVDAFAVSGEAVISVSDSGPGVPAEMRDKIFDPFFTTKQTHQGTGLGLSISRRIAVEHGGRLDLDENSSKTRFILRLPLA